MKIFGWFVFVFGVVVVCLFCLRCPKHEAVEEWPPGLVTETAEVAIQEAIVIEAKAIETRPAVAEAIEVLETATETRVNSQFSFDSLPKPLFDEIIAMQNLIAAQATQIELEIARGDKWKAAATAQQELVALLLSSQGQQIKIAKHKGFKWGLGSGAGAVLLLILL